MVLSILVVAIFTICYVQNIEADNNFILIINESYMTDDSVAIDVESCDESVDIHVVFAFYCDTNLKKIEMQNLSGFSGQQEIIKNNVSCYTSVKVYFSNQSNLSPLCDSLQINNLTGETFEVTFVDYDNTVLNTQEINACNSAVPLVSPSRSGFIFTGWDKDYDCVTSDLVITAMYVEDDVHNIFTLSECEGQVGDQVTVTLEIKGSVNLCAFETKIEYDSDVLEFVSYNNTVSTLDVVVNHVVENEMILLNSTSLENTNSETEILQITFLIKDTPLYESKVIFIDETTSAAYTDGDYNLYPAEYNCINGKVIIR